MPETNNKIFGYLEMTGETLVVLAAALWIVRAGWIPYIFAIGAILMAVGRFAQDHQTSDMTLRRLYRIRNFGVMVLLLSSALMFVRNTMYLALNMYVFPSSWLIFFAVFAVIEVYTTIRILHLTKEN